jgi:hypothetical protein
MIRAWFQLSVPDGVWIADLSTTYPDAEFRLLAGVPLDSRTLELGEIVAADPEAVVAALGEQPSVRSQDVLYVDEERALTRYETTEQGLFAFLSASSLPPEFPLSVRDGDLEFSVTATQDQFDAFGDALDDSGLDYDLRSVGRERGDAGVLTARQRELLEVAFHEGYFEVPRGCRLVDVADQVGVDKSTASETLRRATNRLVDQFLLSTDRPTT